jgi:hypothetical protein
LCAVTLFFAMMNFLPPAAPQILREHFSLDAESNIPTWYSSVLLFAIASVTLGIYWLERLREKPRAFWLIFSGVYCYLSMDEAATIHEAIHMVFRIPWWVYYAPFAVIFFLYCASYLSRYETKELRDALLTGLIVYATGALVIEAIGMLLGHFMHPMPEALHLAEVTVEECFEMLGSSIVLVACLGELSHQLALKFVVRQTPGPSS